MRQVHIFTWGSEVTASFWRERTHYRRPRKLTKASAVRLNRLVRGRPGNAVVNHNSISIIVDFPDKGEQE